MIISDGAMICFSLALILILWAMIAVAVAQRIDRGDGPSWYRKLDLFHGGRTFLRRRGIDTRWGGILIHHLDDADPGMDLHDHPWAFLSIVLRGGYTEEWAGTEDIHGRRRLVDLDDGALILPWANPPRTWSRWSIHAMPLDVAHRITSVEPNTITLVLRTRKVRRWGFYLPTGWIDWEAYPYDERRPVNVASNHAEEIR